MIARNASSKFLRCCGDKTLRHIRLTLSQSDLFIVPQKEARKAKNAMNARSARNASYARNARKARKTMKENFNSWNE
jgi:hypothetical protein